MPTNSTLIKSTFRGQTVDTSAILVKYTYYGDNNLDGVVNATDFGMLIDGLVASSASSWTQGDYTYDGRVDLGNDFNLFLRKLSDAAARWATSRSRAG